MAWGALATGARAATGSTGQGLALMQESLSEITRAELPLVVFNMARGQGDYYQATRGGGHGDYRHLVLAPIDVHEAVVLTQLAFDARRPLAQPGADLRRLPARPHERGGGDRAHRRPPPAGQGLGGGRLARRNRPRAQRQSPRHDEGRQGNRARAFWKRLQAKHDAMAE